MGNLLEVIFENTTVKQQRHNSLYRVSLIIGNNVMRQQLADEGQFVRHGLPPNASKSNPAIHFIRVAETPSHVFAVSLVKQLQFLNDTTAELEEPRMHFTSPYED